MVAVAHQVEHRIVAPEVAGSRPVSHPIPELPRMHWLVLPYQLQGLTLKHGGQHKLAAISVLSNACKFTRDVGPYVYPKVTSSSAQAER